MKTGYDIRKNASGRYDVYFVWADGSELCCSRDWPSRAAAEYDISHEG